MFFSGRKLLPGALIIACLCLLSGLLYTACSSSAPPVVHITPRVYATPTPVTLGAPGCHPASPQDTSNLGFPEAQGTTPAKDLWALFLGGTPRAGEEGEIIWKVGVSFDEPIQIVALGPRGEHLHPLSLERHVSSSWQRSGSEWGTIFKFPKSAGCWDLQVKGGQTVGDVWIMLS
jgi:hypothetical protein